ncbi:MAG: response regulator [Methylocapsa sp.]|nr:response regulator [Methylocapsa sp.]
MKTASSDRILVVDDDAPIRALLRDLLEGEGYAVREAATGQQMLSLLEKEPISLITLDLNLAGEEGLALVRQVRAKRDVPIIMITAKAGDIDKIVGLELGADDYITKPFNLREVLARIRSVLRRSGTPRLRAGDSEGEQERFEFAGFILNTAARELLTAAGDRTELTGAEFNLLKLFVSRPARVLTRDAIMDVLKGQDWTPLDRSIDALVGRLRKKIERDPQHPSLIKTVRGAGYVFTADVARR